jgi:hypothetical protein
VAAARAQLAEACSETKRVEEVSQLMGSEASQLRRVLALTQAKAAEVGL